jgi:hypothetical protein
VTQPRLRATAVLAAAVAVLAAGPAAAQQVTLSMRNGLVTLQATNVPVRQILAEWARVGRVAIGEKIAATPVTLQLADVSERQALDTILRGVAGYLVSSRPGTPDPAQFQFDKVVILPTSAAPPPPPPGPAAAANRQPIFQPGPQVPDPDDGFDEDPELPGAQAPAFQPAQQSPVFQPGIGAVMPRPGGNVMPMPQPQVGQRYQVPAGGYPPSLVTPQTGAPGRTPVPGSQVAPTSPFGAMPAGAPGSITPIPQAIPLSPTNPGSGPPTSGLVPATQ